jgi:hypothetical protein
MQREVQKDMNTLKLKKEAKEVTDKQFREQEAMLMRRVE